MGGGALVGLSKYVILVNTTFDGCFTTNNSAVTSLVSIDSGGGAIFVTSGGTLDAESCIFSNNSAGNNEPNESMLNVRGGAILVDLDSHAIVKSSYFSGNSVSGYLALGGGGGAIGVGGVVSLSNTSFSSNTAPNSYGGDVHVFNGGSVSWNGGSVIG